MNDADSGHLTSDRADAISSRLREMIARGELQLCGLGAHGSEKPIALASKLQFEDPNLDHTDTLIAAAALSCSGCTVFYTNDSTLITSPAIITAARAVGVTVREAPAAR
jgi:hypothetical protein